MKSPFLEVVFSASRVLFKSGASSSAKMSSSRGGPSASASEPGLPVNGSIDQNGIPAGRRFDVTVLIGNLIKLVALRRSYKQTDTVWNYTIQRSPIK